MQNSQPPMKWLVFAAALAFSQQATTTLAAPHPLSWITLGTGGGPLIRQQRSEPANALVINDAVYLFDCGSGTERQLVRAGLSLHQVKAIFVSHHHIDHDADLGQLITSRWMFNSYQPLPIIGPAGTVSMVTHLAEANAAVELAPIGASGPQGKPAIRSTVAPVDLAMTMDVPTEIYKDDNIRVLAITNSHYHFPANSNEARQARSYAYRIETAQRSFVFTGDTGPSAHVTSLAKGADVLISEVIDLDKMKAILQHAADLPAAMLPNMLAHMQEDHLTPTAIGEMAAKAGVKEVVLTHLAPGMDGDTDLSGYSKGIAPTYQGKVRVAEDLQRF